MVWQHHGWLNRAEGMCSLDHGMDERGAQSYFQMLQYQEMDRGALRFLQYGKRLKCFDLSMHLCL